ncbi:hypothetical protein [Gilvibacter sediminis]|uniref:hypothetical protein n=1 Tax=Gilvibacter sediminis TaxID=379071 RepID=UPI0023503DCB|nr:hypothetical protein [Gilvibacter sediminis]MDC7996680.1 hypothetical protein [Gilvibacter sediminis]
MSRLFKILVVCLAVLFGFAAVWQGSSREEDLPTAVDSAVFQKENIYLLLRGSQTKMGGYAREYNRYGGLASHIALGVYTDSLRIYHVNTRKSNPMITESLTSFVTTEEKSYNYLSVWKLKGMTPNKLDSIQNAVNQLLNHEIKFDYKFNSNDENTLYCSEYIYKVLQPVSPALFKDAFYTKEVPRGHRFYLKTDTLHYLPADFILGNKQELDLLFEWELPTQ